MTFEDYLKLENATEHLRVTENNLNIVSGNLNILVSKKVKLEQDIEKLTLISQQKEKEIHDFLDKSKDLKISLNNKVIDTENFVKESEQRIVQNKKELLKILLDIDNITTKYNTFCSLKEKEVSELLVKVKMLELEESSSIKKLDSIMDEIAEKISLRNQISDEIIKFNTEQSDVLIKISDKIKEKNKELSKIEETILEEKDKIKMPLESLALAELKLKKKEDNLNILIARFRKEFKKLHPDLEFKL